MHIHNALIFQKNPVLQTLMEESPDFLKDIKSYTASCNTRNIDLNDHVEYYGQLLRGPVIEKYFSLMKQLIKEEHYSLNPSATSVHDKLIPLIDAALKATLKQETLKNNQSDNELTKALAEVEKPPVKKGFFW